MSRARAASWKEERGGERAKLSSKSASSRREIILCRYIMYHLSFEQRRILVDRFTHIHSALFSPHYASQFTWCEKGRSPRARCSRLRRARKERLCARSAFVFASHLDERESKRRVVYIIITKGAIPRKYKAFNTSTHFIIHSIGNFALKI